MSRTPPWYAWLVMVISVVISVGVSTYSLNRAENAVRAEKQARLDADAARRAQAASSLAAVCNMITSQEAVFRESTGEVGRNAATAWHDLGLTYHCYAK